MTYFWLDSVCIFYDDYRVKFEASRKPLCFVEKIRIKSNTFYLYQRVSMRLRYPSLLQKFTELDDFRLENLEHHDVHAGDVLEVEHEGVPHVSAHNQVPVTDDCHGQGSRLLVLVGVVGTLIGSVQVPE